MQDHHCGAELTSLTDAPVGSQLEAEKQVTEPICYLHEEYKDHSEGTKRGPYVEKRTQIFAIQISQPWLFCIQSGAAAISAF